MEFEKGSVYILVIQLNNFSQPLTFEATITSFDEDSVTFIDKNGFELSYNRNVIVSSKKIREERD